MINAHGGINGRHVGSSRWTTDTRRQKPSNRPGAWWKRKGAGDRGVIRHADERRDPAYLNERRVPQLFIQAGASRWNDPAHFPWTMPVR